jgi:hypothetical protein
MASRKKLTPQKVVGRTHQAFQNSLQVMAFFLGAWCASLKTFSGVSFFRKAISTISIAQISMKPYIIRKEIE